jgi:hypothetical protein
MRHNALTRMIRHAESRDLVGRKVAMLVETPKEQAGRPSKSLTLEQACALLAAAEGSIRTEEALRWELSAHERVSARR